MTKAQLQKRIEELETLVKAQQMLIEGMRILNQFPEKPISTSPSFSTDWCPKGGAHEYPMPWFAITPPTCTKCGHSDSQPFKVTCNDFNAQKHPTSQEMAQAWADFKPVVPFSYLVAARNASRMLRGTT